MLARILMQGSATDTLDSLAREFQQLPIASLAPALVLLLGGLLLLIAGRHFLRPVLVVTAVRLARAGWKARPAPSA